MLYSIMQSCHGCTSPRHNNRVARKWHLHLKKLPALHHHVTAQNHGMTIPSAPPALMSSLPQFLHPMGTTCLTQSGVFDYATWLVGRVGHDQRLKLTHNFTWVDLCAGLGTPCIVYEALRRALQPYGLCPASECTGLTEMSKDKRHAMTRRMVHASSAAPIFRSNEDLTSRLPKI